MQARGWLTWEAEVEREAFASDVPVYRTGAAAAAGGKNLLEQIEDRSLVQLIRR